MVSDSCDCSQSVGLNWVPSHCGIPDNRSADLLARLALICPPPFVLLPYSERKAVRQELFRFWEESSSSLLFLNYSSGSLPLSPLVYHRDEMLFCVLITHGYFLDAATICFPPICHFCNDARLTDSHLLLWPSLHCILSLCFPSMSDILHEDNPYPSVIAFLSAIDILGELSKLSLLPCFCFL